jgi:hypothetical protein
LPQEPVARFCNPRAIAFLIMAITLPSPTVELSLQIPVSGLPVPVGANWFQLSHSLDQVQLLIGYVDPLVAHFAVASARANKSEPTLEPEVLSRVSMSMTGYLRLRGQVEEMFGKLRAMGALDVPDAAVETKE